MKNDNIMKLQELYNKGFKCIRYEEGNKGQLVAYFKNFEDEGIDELTSYDETEIEEIKNYIDNQR